MWVRGWAARTLNMNPQPEHGSSLTMLVSIFISPPVSPAGRKCEVPGRNPGFYCPEIVPGSKRYIFLPGTKNVDISYLIWSIFIIFGVKYI